MVSLAKARFCLDRPSCPAVGIFGIPFASGYRDILIQSGILPLTVLFTAALFIRRLRRLNQAKAWGLKTGTGLLESPCPIFLYSYTFTVRTTLAIPQPWRSSDFSCGDGAIS